MRLYQKLSLKISISILSLFFIFFLCNNLFLSKYYLFQKKQTLQSIVDLTSNLSLNELIDKQNYFESKYDITIVNTLIDSNIEDLNENLKFNFSRKGAALSKFWINDSNLSSIKNGYLYSQIYNQKKLKSSFLVSFFKKENTIFAIATSVSHDQELIKVINQFNLILAFFIMLFMLLIVFYFCKSIIYPIKEIQNASKKIASFEFINIKINTNDELEDLANNINIMSNNLKKYHNELYLKNNNLKNFINNISHEFKTPLALIKSYLYGIYDGLDDGTFFNIIDSQIQYLSDLLTRILDLSKIEEDKFDLVYINPLDIFLNCYEKFKIDIKNKSLDVNLQLCCLKNLYILADKSKLEMVFNNLISNSIFYTQDKKINISFFISNENLSFSIKNAFKNIKANSKYELFEPFFVIEDSRNKRLSSTGLGLTIVKRILDKHNLNYDINLENEFFEFKIEFPIKKRL